MSKREEDLMRTLRTLCSVDNLAEFSSDDFRRYGLDRFITDKAHDIGGFFRKLKANGLIVPIGWKASDFPSNHMRQIQTWKWKEALPQISMKETQVFASLP